MFSRFADSKHRMRALPGRAGGAFGKLGFQHVFLIHPQLRGRGEGSPRPSLIVQSAPSRTIGPKHQKLRD